MGYRPTFSTRWRTGPSASVRTLSSRLATPWKVMARAPSPGEPLMRRFAPPLLIMVMSPSLLLTACGNDVPVRSSEPTGQHAFDRASAVHRMNARLSQARAWTERYEGLKARKTQGEDVEAQLTALQAARPTLTDFKDEALRIVEADPSDADAFQAIGIVMRANTADDIANWEGSPNQA